MAWTKIYLESGFSSFLTPKDSSELSPENPDATFLESAPDQIAKFWVEQLPGHGVRRFKLSTADVGDDRAAPGPPSRRMHKVGLLQSPGRE